MGDTFIVCSFSSGLEDLTRKQQNCAVAILKVLKKHGRFSNFEATDNDTIARMMDRLCNKGMTIQKPDGTLIEYGKLIETDHESEAYPWTKVKLTDGGERLLADADAGIIEWSGAPKKEKS